MIKIYKDQQYTLPIAINARQLAKEKKTKLRKASHRRVLFAHLCAHIRIVEAGFVHLVHYSFILRMIVRYMIQYKTYNPNVIGQSKIF
jgi:hypothetical protein